MAVSVRVLLYSRVSCPHTALCGVSCTITRAIGKSFKFVADANSIPCYDTIFTGAMTEKTTVTINISELDDVV